MIQTYIKLLYPKWYINVLVCPIFRLDHVTIFDQWDLSRSDSILVAIRCFRYYHFFPSFLWKMGTSKFKMGATVSAGALK